MKPLVTDELWAIVESLLPAKPPKPQGGRPRIPDRACLTGILFVLKTCSGVARSFRWCMPECLLTGMARAPPGASQTMRRQPYPSPTPPSSAHLPAAERSRRTRSSFTRLLVWLGVVGPPMSYAVFLAEGATRPGYSAWRDLVSELSHGERGWVQIANFVLLGIAMLGFSVGVRRAVLWGRGAVLGPVFLALTGAGLLIAGVFPMARVGTTPPASHTLHVIGSCLMFGGLAAAALVLAGRFAAPWRWYSTTTAVVLAVGQLTGFGLFLAPAAGTWAGLTQRIAIAVALVWVVLLARRLLAPTSPQ